MKDTFVFKEMGAIEFGILSPKVITGFAAAKIVTPELYDREGYPVDGGLMDIRLGVIDPGLRCKTCGGRLKECPGHFGYIELARPVIHYKFIRHVQNMLSSTCGHCGRILIPDEKISHYRAVLDRVTKEEGPEARRNKIKMILAKMKNKSKCPHCSKKQDKIKLEKPTTFYEGEDKLSPIGLRSRLERIPDKDLELFGYNPQRFRPEWTILTVMPIPPVTMRPSITLETGERSEDDLTHKLSDIIRINQRLFENINAGAPEVIIDDLWDLLQYHVTTYFDNEVPQIPPARHRGGQTLKTLTDRIKSKEGRIRHNLAGKRTDFSARTVISPDPMLSINEVGVPSDIAVNLTIPEKATEWNLEHLKRLVSTGPVKYPGANYVIRPDGKRKRITEETKEEILEELSPGYVIERHLQDGDIALFNRQPSLHKMSMMAHFVRVLPGKTLRLNPAVCAPYNADFDGDEMNLHIPQTEEARAEAECLMLVQNQLISPRYGLCVIGCIQDAVSGNYLLTRDMEMPREEAASMLFALGIEDLSRLSNKKMVTGKEIFSVLLPEDFNFNGKTKSGELVKIKNGEIVSGFMDVLSIGQEKGVMLRSLYEEYGPEKTLPLLDNIFKLGALALTRRGFSIFSADLDLQEETKEKVQAVIREAEQKVGELIDDFHQGKLESLPGRTARETLELRILETLNKARNKGGEIAMSEGRETNAVIMARSGARGNVLNIAQMAAVVGQQALRGKRIDRGYKKRTLSYFAQNDLGPEARGFTRNSFKSGLTPVEFFFGSMTGRESLMDTALRTPKSGYLYRRLSNSLQDVKVEYDGTVRDASGRIVQFQFGEDGIDVSKTENGIINVKRIIEDMK